MNIFGNITSILNPVDTFLWNNEKQAITKQYIAPEVQQKPTMTLFSDEQKMFQKMKEDNLSDDQSFSMLKKRRADILWGNDITQEEKNILLRMQSDNVPVKQAVDMIQKRRKDQFQKKYDEANLLQKWAYNALSFAAGNLETVAKYGGNTLDFITGGQMGFWDEVKKMEQVTKSPEFDSTAFKVGTYAPDVALAVSPIGWWYLAGAKWLPQLALRSGVVGGLFGGVQPILEQGSDVSMWDIATGAATGAAVWAVASPVISKTLKYGKAGYYGWLEGAGKSISRDIKGGVQTITPSGANISTRANRFNANEIRDFKKMTGESPWEFATSRGMTKTGDDAVVEATNRWQASKDQADDALKAIQWRFKFTWEKDFLKTTLDDLDTRLTNTESPDLWRLKKLKSKYEDSGLTMSEINEIKRLYSNNFKYSFVDAGSESALRSRNLQDAVRKWQFKVAEENWLTNLKEINKTTQGWKTFADSLSKKIQGSSGNNAVSLTDWIALSGWSPENIALYLGKKLANSDTIKRWAIKLFSKQTKPSIIQASMWDIQNSNFLKNVNRGVSGAGDNSGGKSLVRPVGLLPAPSGKATWARNVRVNQPMEKAWIKPDITSKSKIVRPTTKPKEGVVVPKAPIVKKEPMAINNTETSQQWADRLTFKNWERKYDYYTLVRWYNDVLKNGKESGFYKNADDYIKSEMVKLITPQKTIVKPKAESMRNTNSKRPEYDSKQKMSKPSTGDTIPDGYFKNAFWEIPKKEVKPVETNITRNETIEKWFSNSAKARWDKWDFTMKERGEATKYLKSNYKWKEYTIDWKKYKVDAIDNRNEQVRLIDPDWNTIRVKINKLPEVKVTNKDIFDYYFVRIQKWYKSIKSK